MMTTADEQEIEQRIPSVATLRESYMIAHCGGKSYIGALGGMCEPALPEHPGLRDYVTLGSAYTYSFTLRPVPEGMLPHRMLLPIGLMLSARVVHLPRPVLEPLSAVTDDHDLEELRVLMRQCERQCIGARKARRDGGRPPLQVVRDIPADLKGPPR